jgi:hypothetical protein
MPAYNVYTRAGDALTLVSANVVAANDREAVANSQSAAGTYYAYPAEVPEATLEASLAAKGWAQEVQPHVVTAAVTRSGTLTRGSRQVTALSATADLRVGQVVNGPGLRGATIKSIDSATAVTLDTDLSRWHTSGAGSPVDVTPAETGVQSLTFAEHVT